MDIGKREFDQVIKKSHGERDYLKLGDTISNKIREARQIGGTKE